MREFDIVYNNIRLRIACDIKIQALLIKHFNNHVLFTEPIGKPTYSLIVEDDAKTKSGEYFRMIDKWFEYATLDAYIDNKNRICYINNVNAKSEKNELLLVQYFVANVFNRLLELNGYLGFHSSCVEKDKNGIVFMAERNSGKTICMLNLMNNGYNSVTNDVIALKKIKDEIIGYGIAQSISIRLGPAFCAQKENQKYVELAIKKGIDIKDKDMLEGNNLYLTDLELATLNNVSQSMYTPIKCIIRPCYDPFITTATFDKISKEHLRELVYSQYRSLVHETTDFLVNLKLPGIDERERYKHFDDILTIPAYYCRQNEHTTEQFVEGIEKIRKHRI